MNSFTVIRSVLLVCTVYFAFIVNNSFSQLFTSQLLLSSLLLSIIIADLLSSGYKVVYGNSPGFSFFAVVSILLFVFLPLYPVFINYLIIFTSLLLYNYLISFAGLFFEVQDQLYPLRTSHVSSNNNFTLFEIKGILFTTYRIEYNHPLFFISDFDKRSFMDIIKNNKGIIYTSDGPVLKFGLAGRDIKFLSTEKDNLYKIISDIEKITVNLHIE